MIMGDGNHLTMCIAQFLSGIDTDTGDSGGCHQNIIKKKLSRSTMLMKTRIEAKMIDYSRKVLLHVWSALLSHWLSLQPVSILSTSQSAREL
jgi:hypothetical protein